MNSDEQLLLETKRFRVVRIFPERLPPREVVRHPGAVTILPLLEDGRICLIQNYRASVDRTLIELPAGTLEPSESPKQTAARELTEETGFVAGNLQSLHEYYLSPGVLDERMHVFVATELSLDKPNREPDERIENLVVSIDEALAMVRDQRIQDAKTIASLLFYDRFAK
jgi:ADP-ribose pyrophosphatase